MAQTNLTPGKTFAAGRIAGFFVLCTVGFFIMLGVYLSGGGDSNVRAGEGDILVVDEYPEQFSQCLDSGKYANTVKNDIQLGASFGVQGTPATFINGYLVSGALPFANVAQVIDAVLAGEEPEFDFLRDRETGEITKVDLPELPNVEWVGDANASVTIVEFSDFECPYCERFVPIVKEIGDDYGFQVLAVSENGENYGPFKGVKDTGILHNLNEEGVVPLLFLVHKDGKRIYPIARGITDADKIAENILSIKDLSIKDLEDRK